MILTSAATSFLRRLLISAELFLLYLLLMSDCIVQSLTWSLNDSTYSNTGSSTSSMVGILLPPAAVAPSALLPPQPNTTEINAVSTRNSNTSQTIISDMMRTNHSCGIADGWDQNKNIWRPYHILMAISEDYFPSLLNWLIYFHTHCPDRSYLHLLCLNGRTDELLRNYGLSCSSIVRHDNNNHQPHMSLNHIWLKRVEITTKTLVEGYDVLLSDVDAIWLRNPFTIFEKFPQSDIIGSRGSFPEVAYSAIGATLCMGFLYIKSNSNTISLFKELLDTMLKQSSPDDQEAINVLLLSKQLTFGSRLSYPGNIDDDANTGHFKSMRGTGNITLIAHSVFRRLCTGVAISQIHQSVVAHCLSNKNGKSKHSAATAYGMWSIADAWKEVRFHTMNDFLLKIKRE